MFFERFKILCAQKRVSPTKASEEIGFSKGMISRWHDAYKKGVDLKPGMEIAQKISLYFDVSLDYLLGNYPPPPPPEPIEFTPRKHVLRDTTPIALMENPIFTDRELVLIDAYRRHPELQPLIDHALGLTEYSMYYSEDENEDQ